MEADMINPDDINCIAFLNKKRKVEDELVGMPMSKQVCWDRRLVCNYPCDSTIEPKMMGGSIFVESEAESASSSNSFRGDDDMSMPSPQHDAKTHLSYPQAYAFAEDSSSQIGPCSPPKPISGELEPPSICEELHCLYREYGLKLPDNYDHHLQEFGCVDEGIIDNQVYSHGTAGSNFVLSSGRRPVNQDSEEGAKKLTIDKEFELYFSALML